MFSIFRNFMFMFPLYFHLDASSMWKDKPRNSYQLHKSNFFDHFLVRYVTHIFCPFISFYISMCGALIVCSNLCFYLFSRSPSTMNFSSAATSLKWWQSPEITSQGVQATISRIPPTVPYARAVITTVDMEPSAGYLHLSARPSNRCLPIRRHRLVHCQITRRPSTVPSHVKHFYGMLLWKCRYQVLQRSSMRTGWREEAIVAWELSFRGDPHQPLLLPYEGDIATSLTPASFFGTGRGWQQ